MRTAMSCSMCSPILKPGPCSPRAGKRKPDASWPAAVPPNLWADDPSFISLVERLRSSSPEFSDWWVAHDIDAVVSGEKVLHHPVRGARRFAYASFQANDDPALKLAIYTER